MSEEEAEKFIEADYYSVDESTEQLYETDYLVAIGELIEDNCGPKAITEVIADISPLRIYGWKRKTLPEDHKIGNDAIDSMLYDFEEYWAEEYGCPFSDTFPAWPKDTLSSVKEKLYATMKECIAKAHIWQCDQNSSMLFSEEELTEITKKHYPELWEEQTCPRLTTKT